MDKNCLLCGVGGQGTVLASKLIAYAAMNKGQTARTAETIGMAQRGGCVVSHVRIGDVIHSSMIGAGRADVIIGFEPGEAVRVLPYLKEGGTVIINKKSVAPVTASLGNFSYNGGDMIEYLKKRIKNLIIVDGDAICAECGSPKVLNAALLGAAAASGAIGLTVDELENAVVTRMPEKFHALNKKALSLGADSVR